LAPGVETNISQELDASQQEFGALQGVFSLKNTFFTPLADYNLAI